MEDHEHDDHDHHHDEDEHHHGHDHDHDHDHHSHSHGHKHKKDKKDKKEKHEHKDKYGLESKGEALNPPNFLPSPASNGTTAIDFSTISVGLTERRASSDPWRANNSSISFREFEDAGKKLSLSNIFRVIWNDQDSRHLFLFIFLLAAAVLMQLYYGFTNGSLGLLSAAFHTSCDLIGMNISLAAMVLAKHQPTKRFSYGYDRWETLSSFTNGVFLLFVSLFLTKEIIERMLEGEFEEIHTEGMASLSIVAIVVNVIGVIWFREHAKASHRHELRHAHEENIYTILTHMLLDIVGNVGNILSAWMMAWGFYVADTIVALGIIALMVYNAIPICSRTGRVLLQTMPLSMKDQFEKSLREASTLVDIGVIECKDEHFWTQAPGVFVGTLVVRVRNEANEQVVLQRVHNLFRPLVTHLTVQIDKE